jgi:hypothetical protein
MFLASSHPHTIYFSIPFTSLDVAVDGYRSNYENSIDRLISDYEVDDRAIVNEFISSPL